MSATQDLIAAALTAADKLDIIGGHFSITADGVRELCARAMVQPDMGEVEKLLCIHENVVRMHANGLEWDKAPSATRAALLDYVRDHFGDVGKMVQPVGEVPMPELETRDNDLPALPDLPDLVEMDDARWGYRADDMRDYGEDCWEAGYAAGVAAGGQDADVDCSTCQYASPTRHELCNGCEQTVTVFRNYKRASWATMSGEVKP